MEKIRPDGRHDMRPLLLCPSVCLFLCSFIKPQLAIARLQLHAPELSICLSVCPSVCRQNAENAVFSKTKQFRAMVSIDNLLEVI